MLPGSLIFENTSGAVLEGVLGRYLRKGEKDETLDVGRIFDVASSSSKLSSTEEADCRSIWGNVASVGVLLRANGRSQSAILKTPGKVVNLVMKQ